MTSEPSRLAQLPGFDTAPDVYETPDLDEIPDMEEDLEGEEDEATAAPSKPPTAQSTPLA